MCVYAYAYMPQIDFSFREREICRKTYCHDGDMEWSGVNEKKKNSNVIFGPFADYIKK